MTTNERLREIRKFVASHKGNGCAEEYAFLLASLDEVVKLAREYMHAPEVTATSSQDDDQKAVDAERALNRCLAELEKGE